jgi:hypothetical protein
MKAIEQSSAPLPTAEGLAVEQVSSPPDLALMASQFREALERRPEIRATGEPLSRDSEPRELTTYVANPPSTPSALAGSIPSSEAARAADPIPPSIAPLPPQGSARILQPHIAPEASSPHGPTGTAGAGLICHEPPDTPQPGLDRLPSSAPRLSSADTPADVDAEPETLGAAVLQSLLNHSSAAPAPAVLAPTPASRIQELESFVAETVSRVLVSDPLHDGRREVRVTFAREILPDTEVRLWRHEGRLHIEFAAPTSIAEGGLKEALPRLPELIQQRHPEREAPLVALRQASGETGGTPGDGRSRQRYVWPQEAEDTA